MTDKEVKKLFKKRKHEYDTGKRCRVCGFGMVEVRGKHPNEPKRKVCAQCLQEKIDRIQEISHPDYGKSFQDIE